MSAAAAEFPSPVSPAGGPSSPSAALEPSAPLPPPGGEQVITVVDQHLQDVMGTVKITVAIQAAEDEEPEEVSSSNNIDFLGGGSCSEDDQGRHDKSRQQQ